MEHTYKITGMTCAKCSNKVKDELLGVDGITGAEVSLGDKTAKITMSRHVDTDRLNAALRNAGDYSLQEASSPHSNRMEEKSVTYKPLILIFFYLTGLTIINESYHGSFDIMRLMNNFMGGFFLIFSFFKLLDLKGFAESYSSYDVIAQKWFSYGYIYPFIELVLGLAYLFNFEPLTTNIVTIIVMGISSIGVFKSILRKSKIQCACLGTVFNLPMSTITLIEDLLMVIMAAIMILIIL